MTLFSRDARLPVVGARINYASNLGTVRYVGDVEGTKGVWLGVEWDDARRGRHSGSKDGRQYFTCAVPNSATFVRPTSSSVVLGQTFLRALSAKYGEAPLLETAAAEKVTLGSSRGAIEVEAVGLNKVRSKLSRFERLREVGLYTENVAYADPPGEIRNTCPNIRGLDLSHSLVPSWEVIANITRELPWLETLTLNNNRFQPSSREILANSFSHISDLRINGTLTSWDTMLALLPSFPKLQHLEMALNHLEILATTTPSAASTSLASLNLEHNDLQNWQNTMDSLAGFPHLERLIISGNMISSIPTPSPNKPKPQIKHLSVASNDIQNWSDINSLYKWFPELQNLKINNNFIDQEPSSRPLVIARHPGLMSLNASVISSAERRDSELFYLAYISRNSPPSRSRRSDRERDFPRYAELCEKYGEAEDVREEHPQKLRDRLIEVNVFQISSQNPTRGDLPDYGFSLRLLPSMPLRHLCSKILKTIQASPRENIRLWLVLEVGTRREFAELGMDDSSKPIEWWGVENGGKIAFAMT